MGGSVRALSVCLVLTLSVTACTPGSESAPDEARAPSSSPSSSPSSEAPPLPSLQPLNKKCRWEIGAFGAFSGRYGHLGRQILRGAKLAVAVHNARKELPCRLSLVQVDTKGNPNIAIRKIGKITRRKKLIACICGTFSGETLETGDTVSAAGIPFTSTGTNTAVGRQGFRTWFRATASDKVQGAMVGLYIEKVLAAKRVVTVHDGFDYSVALASGVAKSVGRRNLKTLKLKATKASSQATARKIKRLRPDVVFYGGYVAEAARLVRHLRVADVKARFITDDGAKDPEFGTYAQNAAHGALTSCSCGDPTLVPEAQLFVDIHWKKYGTDPTLFSGDIYDFTSFVARALKRAKPRTSPARLRQMILRFFKRSSGLQGAMKRYSWDKRGELDTDPSYVWIYEWNPGHSDFEALGRVSQLIKEAQ